MLVFKCKSRYVLWNRIIITLIYQCCTVSRDGWKELAKNSLTSSKRINLLNYTKGFGINTEASVYEICFPLDSMKASPHCRWICNYFTSGHVQNKHIQGHFLISHMVSM